MAKRATKKRTRKAKGGPVRRFLAWFFGWEILKGALRWALRAVLALAVLAVLLVALFSVVRPPATPYMLAERFRLGALEHSWVPIEDVAPAVARSIVAAEDANFCLHWGFDMGAIRAAIADGSVRGASTITQQVVKNVWLWHGRSWPRKALEAMITPAVEAAWPKRRILELYLNLAEFDEGVFGVEAASRHYFGIKAADLSAVQAARLAAVLPDPKGRSAATPSPGLRSRAAAIMDGAATIARDGRAACFED